MGELSEIAWALGIAATFGLSATGLGLLAMSYFPQAKLMAYIAPLPLAIADIIWTTTTSLQLVWQIAISVAVGFIIGGGTLEMVRLVREHEKRSRR